MLLFVFTDYFVNYLPVAGAVIAVALSLAALAYAVGAFLSNEQVKTWARMEVTEAFYSAVILAFALFLFALMDESIASALNSYDPTPHYGGTSICTDLASTQGYSHLPCHMAVAKSFFSDVFDQGSLYLYSILRQYSRFTYLSTMSITFDSMVNAMGSMNFSPFAAYLQAPVSIYSYIFDFGVKSLILLKFQQILIEFINSSVFPVFFTLGVALRAFPAMRKLGGLLMAAAVAFYYVYPAFFVLGSMIFSGMMDADKFAGGDGMVMDAPLIDFTPLKMPMNDPDLWGQRQQLSSAQQLRLGPEANICRPAADNPTGFSATDEIYEFMKVIWEMLGFGVSGVAWGSQFDDWIFGPNGVVNGAARMVFFSLFFSFLAIMSTIAATKTLSPLLGGDIEIAGLTHLV